MGPASNEDDRMQTKLSDTARTAVGRMTEDLTLDAWDAHVGHGPLIGAHALRIANREKLTKLVKRDGAYYVHRN